MMHDLQTLQEHIDNTFSAFVMYERLSKTAAKPETRLMYRRRLAIEQSEVRRLQNQINELLQQEIENV